MMFISMSQLMQIMTKHGKLTTHVQILNSGSNQIENKSWQPPELRWKVEHSSLKGSLLELLSRILESLIKVGYPSRFKSFLSDF